jgi:hypothetical protein
MSVLIRQRDPQPNEFLMGLESHGYVMFPGCDTEFDIPILNNKYNLGLGENQEEFENYFGVKFDTPEGKEFLDSYRIKLRHDVNPLDDSNMDHRFNLAILKANGGLGIVQFNDESTDLFARYPFVATDEDKDIEKKVSKKVIRNSALSELEKLQKNKPKMFRIAKYIFDVNSGIFNTNADVAYDRLDEYIVASNDNATAFLNTLKLDQDYIDVVITVKAAMVKGIIRLTPDKWLENHANGTKMGRNLEEVVKYLNNPNNQDQLGLGNETDTPYSIKRQIKESLN